MDLWFEVVMAMGLFLLITVVAMVGISIRDGLEDLRICLRDLWEQNR